MSKISFDKKLEGKKLYKPVLNSREGKNSGKKATVLSKVFKNDQKGEHISGWNFVYAFVLFSLIFFALILNVAKLQIVQGEDMLNRSQTNKVRLISIEAFRGVVFDVQGKKLTENILSVDVYISLEFFRSKEGLDNEELERVSNTLGGILGDAWNKQIVGDGEYSSISERIYALSSENPYINKILLASDIGNDMTIQIKALGEELKGISLDNGSKRNYVYEDVVTHLLGYTGEVSEADLKKNSDLLSGDIVGKAGIEKYYEEELKGVHGILAQEVDAFGRGVSNEPYVLREAQSGMSLYLTVNLDVQRKMYSLLQEAVEEYSAAGGAGIIQDVNSGELLAIVNYPSYDNNLFVGGISQKDYDKLINNPNNPLLDRAISAQIPPGSTFKTVVAAAALEEGVINKGTRYLSKTGYTFSNGAPFQEFRNHAYGSLNVEDALMVSSNIFFCELIRDWDINELIPYLESFGVGQYTGIDIPGEMLGRIPSPENKKVLAQTTSPWLDEIWYPEGDSCNSVIGQGITLATPIQMSNWIAAIANGGTLYTPHVGKYFVNEDGLEFPIEHKVIQKDIVSDESLELVRKGMWKVVNGPRGIAKSLSSTGTSVAAKTGTAEFGKLNDKGQYENTHAWVTGFFPYDNPKYSFSLLLEDGGSSANAVSTIREMITWMVSNGFTK